MSFFALTPGDIETLLLIFVRIGALCMTAPVLSSHRVPVYLRAGISIFIAALLLPTIPGPHTVSASLGLFVAILVKEALIGLAIGFTANLVFTVTQMAGEMQDTQAGFGFAGVVDPNMGQQSAIIGQFQMVLMWLVFFTANGHHVLLQGIAESFTLVPLGTFAMNGDLLREVFSILSGLLAIVLQVSGPIVGAVLLTDLALGMLQRTAPQLNLMAVGFQVKIAVSTAVFLFALPYILYVLRGLVPYMADLMQRVMVVAR